MIVQFLRNNARIIKHPEADKHYPNSVVDPDLAPLRGIPPHHWKLKGDQVVAMSDSERAARDADIKEHGCDNQVIALPKAPSQGNKSKLIGYALLGAGVAGLLAYLLF